MANQVGETQDDMLCEDWIPVSGGRRGRERKGRWTKGYCFTGSEVNGS